LASDVVFDVKSRLDRKVRLTDIQWSHIETRHKELRGQLNKMKQTLIDPDIVYHSAAEETHQYYRKFTKTPVTEKYLLLVVKHQDGEGFIITAFFVGRIRRREKVLVYGSENSHLV